MNYFDFNPGDFYSLVQGMDFDGQGIAISLISRLATTEKPIKTQWVKLGFPVESQKKAMDILEALFVETPDGWIFPSVWNQVIKYQANCIRNKENGRKGGRPKKNAGSETETQINPTGYVSVFCKNQTESLTNNQEPITNNHIDVVNDTTCHMSEETSDDGLFGEEQVQKTGQTGAPNCPTKQIVDLYHQILPELPKVTLITTARQSSTRSRWRDLYGAKDFETLEQGLNVFREYFEIVKSRDFLMGRCKPSGGREVPFRADYDWLMKQANFLKVCEGKYANARRK